MSLSKALKNRLFWRVYIIWFLRRIVPLIILQVLALALAFRVFANNVFVSQVFKNAGLVASVNYLAILKYLVKAFLNTHPIIQIVAILALGFGALILRDIGRSLVIYWYMRRKR